MADRWRNERARAQAPRDRDDLRYAGETILGRADWGDRESDYEHGFRPPRGAEEWRGTERDPRWRAVAIRSRRTGAEPDDYRFAGETILGRADWGDRESDYEHGFRAYREGRWPTDRGEHTGKGPRGYQRNDQRVFEDVCDRLTDDPRVDATEIEVQVENGEVTLTGTVRSREEKHRAEDTIESISGVRDVHNHLRVSHGAIGEHGAPQTPLGLSSPGGDSRGTVPASERKNRVGVTGAAQRSTARATAREHAPGIRGRRSR
jgi:hypothetical protein